MSKGITCDICRKTTDISDYDRTCFPPELDGWLHLGVTRNITETSVYGGIKNNRQQYHEIDICPKCAEKIRGLITDYDFAIGMNDSGNSGALSLIREIFGE